MYFRKAGRNEAVAASTRIKQLQFNLISKSSPYSILAAAFAATVQFLLLEAGLDSPLLDIWLASSLLIYLLALLLLRQFARKKEKYRADYAIAGQLLIAFAISIGLLWGSSGLIFIPLVDAQAQIVILVLTMAVVTAIALTLSYRHTIAIAFIVLVLVPLMVGIHISDGLAALAPYLSIFLLTFYLLLLVRFVLDTRGNLEQMLNKEAQSVHRLRELRDKAEHANRVSRDKSKFIANMSHEMRTPMHAILGFSDLGAKKSTSMSREKLQDYFLRINESGQRLLNLLDSLINLSNLEAGRMHFEIKNNDMTATIDSVIAQMRTELEERSVDVEVVSKLDVPVAQYDNDKLMLVIRNLLSNALKFSPIDSVISIVVEAASLPSMSTDSEQEYRPALSISVKDQGTGIAENELESIFDKLAQSSKKALSTGDSGLGLSICKEIIRHHDGTIVAHNNTAAGATFTFTIPIGDRYEAAGGGAPIG